MTEQTISHYHQHAARYQAQYDSVTARDVHADWASMLNELTPGLALDVGAGGGRDALWLAQQGWRVSAVEPAAGLRALGQQNTGRDVEWFDAQLPELQGLPTPEQGYDLILLSAVWMHLPPAQRPIAFQRLCDYLSPKGTIIVTLRFGPSDPDRPMFAVSIEELAILARQRGLELRVLSEGLARDRLQRTEVSWQTVCLQSTGGNHE